MLVLLLRVEHAVETNHCEAMRSIDSTDATDCNVAEIYIRA